MVKVSNNCINPIIINPIISANKKTLKAIKIPHIKRPMNSFMLWSKKYRLNVSRQNSSLDNANISIILGKIWNTLSIAEREIYDIEALKIKNQFYLDNPGYIYKPIKKITRKHTYRNRNTNTASNIIPDTASNTNENTYSPSNSKSNPKINEYEKNRDEITYLPPIYVPNEIVEYIDENELIYASNIIPDTNYIYNQNLQQIDWLKHLQWIEFDTI